MLKRTSKSRDLLERISDEGRHLFGLRPVTPAVLDRLVARFGLGLMRAEFSVLSEISPPFAGKRWIMLRAGLPFALDRLLLVRALICAAAPTEVQEGPEGPRAATVAALAALLSAHEVARKGERFLARKRHFLADERAVRLWGEAGLDELLQEAAAVVRQLQRSRGWEAYRKGRAARDVPNFKRAAVWFRRAVRCARQAQDTLLEALALVGLGKVYEFTADYLRARTRLLAAARIARRHGHRTAFAYAMHDLEGVAVEQCAGALVSRYALAAFRAYPARSEYRLAVASDVAAYWIFEGDFSRAQAVLEVIAPRFALPSHRVACYSLLARAAGCAGNPEAYVAAVQVVERELAAQEMTIYKAQAFYNIGWGAFGVGDTEAAEVYARDADALASQQESATLARRVGELLEALSAGGRLEWMPRGGDNASEAFALEVLRCYRREGDDSPSR